jgi:apolipoprotein N-acyltransferase
VPLLLLSDICESQRVRPAVFLSYSYVSFIIWNVGTTWWVYNATAAGSIMAFVFNALFMALVFMLFYITRCRLGKGGGLLGLAAYWTAFEYLHLEWDLSWPWLTLGNGFSEYYTWIQWYEYTGVFGGGLWIWAVNILVYLMLGKFLKEGVWSLKLAAAISVLLILPVAFSLLIYHRYEDKGRPAEIVVTQPNIDPYSEKFSAMPEELQLARFLQLGSTMVDTSTDYLIAPETALPDDHREDLLEQDRDIRTLRAFLANYPKLNIIAGISSSRIFRPGEKLSSTARKFQDADIYFDAYNTSMQIDNSPVIQLYHKSKLVPGVEKMPYPTVFRFLEDFAIDLGGTVGSYGMQEERTAFSTAQGWKAGAPICYESVYGEFITGYVRNGAHFIFIITNDGWWGDTPGYKQHLSYGRLRAIETRRSIARSANTGISCFINQKGDISQETPWWEPAVIKGTLLANEEITFYVRYGDYIAKFLSVVAIGLLLFIFASTILKRVRK